MKLSVSQFPDIETAQAHYHERLSQLVTEARTQVLTDLPLQSEVYRAKADEAARYLQATQAVVPSAFPWLTAEAAATGRTLDQVAEAIQAQARRWSQVGPRLEAVRLRVAAELTAATTSRAMHQAVEAAKTELQEALR